MYEKTKYALELAKPSDWWVWIACIRNFAAARSIWVYVDPDGTTPEPKKPVLDPSLLNAESILETHQRDEVDLRHYLWLLEYDQYKECFEMLLELRTAIDESIPPVYRLRLGPELSIREMIRFLRAKFKPSHKERVKELDQRLQYLSTPNRETLTNKWFLERHGLVLPEAQRLVTMVKKEGGKDIDICRQILCFQSEYALSRGAFSHDDAFGTFQGRPQANGTPNSSIENVNNGQPHHRKDKRNDCFCGQIHRFKQCPYVNPAVQPAGWVPDPTVQARFDGPMHPAVQNILNRARKGIATKANRKNLQQPASPQPKPRIVAFYTSRSSSKPPSDYELRDSWLINSLSNRHACNDLSRFKTLNPAQDENIMIFGGSFTPIMGYGTVIVNADGCNGERATLELKDTAYMPDLHTNIVSLQKAEQAGIYYNGRLNRLEKRDGQPLCHIYSHYSQFVAEYNPREDTHTSTAAVDHLTAVTEGISLS